MLREDIEKYMNIRGVNQTTLCNKLGIAVSNFNSFIRGKRTLKFEDLLKVMVLLRVTFGPSEEISNDKEPELIGEILKQRAEQKNLKIREVAEMSGINACTVCSLMTGKRFVSTRVLTKILSALDIAVVPFRKSYNK